MASRHIVSHRVTSCLIMRGSSRFPCHWMQAIATAVLLSALDMGMAALDVSPLQMHHVDSCSQCGQWQPLRRIRTVFAPSSLRHQTSPFQHVITHVRGKEGSCAPAYTVGAKRNGFKILTQ